MSKSGLRNAKRFGKYGRFVLVCTAAVAIAYCGVRAEEGQGSPPGEGQAGGPLRLISVEPTVLFVREQGSLLQVAEVELESTAELSKVKVEVKLGTLQRTTGLGNIAKGKTKVEIYVPEIIAATEAEFVIRVDKDVAVQQKMMWQPQRHWKVYVVPITHHDLGYTDTIENVLNQYDGFYDDVIRFCEQTKDWPDEAKYRYTVESTWSLKHFVAHRPKDVINKFAKYVNEGRIEIGAFFGNEISCLCGHEELIRLMYPSFEYARMMGGVIRTASITDVPGLSWGLPTVLSGAGVRYFFAGLPTYFEWGRNDIHTFWDESAVLRHGRPDAFWWEGPDGGSVLVYYQGSYGFFKATTGPNSYEYVLDNLPGMLEAMQKEDTPFSVVRYIHNGVDNHPPSVKISDVASEWNEKWAYPQLIVATNRMFFEALELQCQNIRTFRGELPDTDYVVGAVSTAKETGINRITHERLQSAEKSATIASLVSDYKYPANELREAYDCMLLYDEHTWGRDYPEGEVQDWAWNEKSQYAYKAAGLVKPILSGSLDSIAHKIELNEEGQHIVVFNSLSFERTDVVRVEKLLVKEPFDLIDTDGGAKVAYQRVRLDGPQAAAPYSAYRHARGQFEEHELFDLVFVADAVPSMGYKTYRIAPREEAESPAGDITVGQGEIENRFFKVVLDSATGAVKSIYDKELSREMVDANANDGVNQFVARWVQTGKLEGPREVTIQEGQKGPVYGSIVARSEGAGCPQITQEVILYDGIKRIDFANRVLKDSTPLLEIYFAFPFKIDDPAILFEGSNSVIKPLRDQFPGSNSNYYSVQHWANVSNGEAGVTLSAAESHLMEFGGLWPCYVSQAHHGLDPPGFGAEFVKAEDIKKGHIYSFVMDGNFRTNFQPVQQGDMLFRYSVATHKGQWKEGRRNFGWAAGNPLMPVVVDGKRDGTLDRKASFCSVSESNVMLLTLKRAEDGSGIIIRLIETEGSNGDVSVSLPFLTIKGAYATNLVEENKEGVVCARYSFMTPIKAYGIKTIRVQGD
ncbi:MAG: hypothetical protein JXN61_06815 [Sedimentisphaerales bacterium]|nr:hypothetical protein [Sedimentisphaerales bacterium]